MGLASAVATTADTPALSSLRVPQDGAPDSPALGAPAGGQHEVLGQIAEGLLFTPPRPLDYTSS
jgi:hypothetical protein